MTQIKITRLFKIHPTFIGESKVVTVPDGKELHIVTPCCYKCISIPLTESTKYQCPICDTQYLFELGL